MPAQTWERQGGFGGLAGAAIEADVAPGGFFNGGSFAVVEPEGPAVGGRAGSEELIEETGGNVQSPVRAGDDEPRQAGQPAQARLQVGRGGVEQGQDGVEVGKRRVEFLPLGQVESKARFNGASELGAAEAVHVSAAFK